MGYIDISKLNELRKLHNTYYKVSKNLTALNRFKIRFPSNELDGMIAHVFFTKPDCNFFTPGSNGTVPVENTGSRLEFNQLYRQAPEVLRSLQSDQGNNGPFINQLCNNVFSLPVEDTVIKTRESGQTANDWKITYGHRANDSRSSGTVSIDFVDNKELYIFNTFYSWVNYIDLITKGDISPNVQNIKNRILDYACSIFYFVTDATGVNVLYWCKYIGAFPTNIPESVFSANNGLTISPKLEYSISFNYSIKDTSFAVITDFQLLTSANEIGSIPFDISLNRMKPTYYNKVSLVRDMKTQKFKLYYL